MSGTGASNLGYGNTIPFNNINNKLVNVTNSHNPAMFSSKQIAGSKRKNISKIYKNMKKKYSHSRRKKTKCRKHNKLSKKYTHKQTGRYGQYYNNTPVSTSYSTGGILSPNNLALANPVPHQLLKNPAIDNYNRVLNVGYPSKNS